MGKVKQRADDEALNIWHTICEKINNSTHIEELNNIIDFAVREARVNQLVGIPSMIPDIVTELWNETHQQQGEEDES